MKTTQSLFLSSSSVGWADYVLLYPFWIGVIIAAELFFPFLLLDIVLLLTRFRDSWRRNTTRKIPLFRLIIGVAVCLYVPTRIVSDTMHVRSTEVHIALPGLPAELQGTKLTLLADLQVDRYTGAQKIDQVESIVKARTPDFLLSGGDLVTNGTAFLNDAGRVLCDLTGKWRSVGVLGDHDYWSAPSTIRNLYEQCGWQFLENEHRLYTLHDRTVLVSGLTYIYSKKFTHAELAAFLNHAPAADVKILLTHQPAEMVVQQAADHGYDLVLAGHTHGGQIVLHPLGIPVTPSMFETEYFRGEYLVGKTHVVVTRGVGLTLAPIRYHAPAEVTTVMLGK
jgi:predicted MPP superfamily phosphohydrolase